MCRDTASLALRQLHWGVRENGKASGFTPNVVFAGNESSVIRGFIKPGFSIALDPESTVRNGLVTLHVRAPKPIRCIGIAWLRDRYRTEAERALDRWVSEPPSGNRRA